MRTIHLKIVDVPGLLVDARKKYDAGGGILAAQADVLRHDRIPSIECRVVGDHFLSLYD